VFNLAPLPYSYDGLESIIDKQTLEIHHSKHHQTYVTNLNNVYKGPITDLAELQYDIFNAGPGVRNNGGQHYNHAFYWEGMAPPGVASKTKPSAQLEQALVSKFGSVDKMKEAFNALAAPGKTFGSGWVWLTVDAAGSLDIVTTSNGDNPLMKGVFPTVSTPILVIDLWEHAYYLKYQNRRPEYVENWWKVVNWEKVSENFEYATANKKAVPVRG
jgi:Fe-Mn family superoxide dismutase